MLNAAQLELSIPEHGARDALGNGIEVQIVDRARPCVFVAGDVVAVVQLVVKYRIVIPHDPEVGVGVAPILRAVEQPRVDQRELHLTLLRFCVTAINWLRHYGSENWLFYDFLASDGSLRFPGKLAPSGFEHEFSRLSVSSRSHRAGPVFFLSGGRARRSQPDECEPRC